ncbi:conserved hypothetical protein [Leishmania major strain Friedlin]|uniref:Uncharacterized protein n=1 Tax=Leishmania major TaxID=5664 RepID=Q4Q915_LEIMA|nr:conserved hypothetical protein [Leishmania major strain Friedlin]CAG9576501.1 hypothetical_protein_-_conserved [Leishmania major strain Friedlin]CAJ05420.1 conserved hypothetical protein [Leishmania major strain Friedlin]|eukprot:XP_001684183.1 conserved hypothetical protein [Leishmania major strain Friedlin]
MSASTLPNREGLGVSPAREVVGIRGPFASTPKAAATDSTSEEGAGAPSECDAATAGVSKGSAFEVRVKSTGHHERRRPRCCSDASGTLQTARSERSSCARQDNVTDTDASATAPATCMKTQNITSETAGRGPLHSSAESTTTPSLLEHHVQDALQHSSYSDGENASVPASAANTVNSIGCTEVPPTTAVTIWVPTQFTTAAGRAICLRERRLLTAASPYWRLLCFDPAREAIVAPPGSSADECDHDEEAVLGDAGELSDTMPTAKNAAEQLPADAAAAALRGAIGESCCAGTVSAASPLTSTYAGYAWVHRCVRRRRAASCPERVLGSWSYASVGRDADYSLPLFSGFCAADGRPFYCHYPSASAEGQDRQQRRSGSAEGA